MELVLSKVPTIRYWNLKITDLSVERVNNDQSALFNNPLNSAQILAGNGRFLNFSTEWYRGRYFWQH